MKRYTVLIMGSRQDDSGDWVKYADASALEADQQILRKAVAEKQADIVALEARNGELEARVKEAEAVIVQARLNLREDELTYIKAHAYLAKHPAGGDSEPTET